MSIDRWVDSCHTLDNFIRKTFKFNPARLIRLSDYVALYTDIGCISLRLIRMLYQKASCQFQEAFFVYRFVQSGQNNM